MIAKLIMKYVQRKFNPKIDGSITNHEINKLFKGASVFIGDSKYDIANMEDIDKFLSFNIFKFRKYVPERYDCDNYAFSLMGMFTNLMSGYAIGIVWADTPSGKHALNFFIDLNYQIWYIEPQTNEIFQHNKYVPYFVVM